MKSTQRKQASLLLLQRDEISGSTFLSMHFRIVRIFFYKMYVTFPFRKK